MSARDVETMAAATASKAGALRVVVVEDEVVVAEDLRQRLGRLGFSVAGIADTAADALELAIEARPDVVLMDIMLHGKPEGIEAARRIAEELDLPVVFLTAHSDARTLQAARASAPCGYVVKPFQDEQVRAAVEMAGARLELERKAKRAAGWFGAVLSCIGDAVLATDEDGTVVLLNQEAERLTGWNRKQALGRPASEVLQLVHAGRDELQVDPATRALSLQAVCRVAEDTVLVARDGRRHAVDDSAAPIRDEDGAVLGAVVVLVDAESRAAASARAAALESNLAKATAEADRQLELKLQMEAFAASVSHDLKAPLRAISCFSDALAERYGAQLDAGGRHFLQRVRSNAAQMTGMVEDYLAFLASLREWPMRPEPADLRQLACEVFEGLDPARTAAVLHCDEVPHAQGDLVLLRRLLANLLGNALKFSAGRAEPHIELGAQAGTELHTYYLRDNGVGFAASDHLFEPFHRCHASSEFPGTGLGLAICRRIVQQHGGTLWAESKPGAGATFYFTLPAA